MTDDPKLLRAEADYYHGEWQKAVAENEKLRAALKPFADAAADFIAEKHDMNRAIVALGDLRAAAAALKETGEDIAS